MIADLVGIGIPGALAVGSIVGFVLAWMEDHKFMKTENAAIRIHNEIVRSGYTLKAEGETWLITEPVTRSHPQQGRVLSMREAEAWVAACDSVRFVTTSPRKLPPLRVNEGEPSANQTLAAIEAAQRFDRRGMSAKTGEALAYLYGWRVAFGTDADKGVRP